MKNGHRACYMSRDFAQQHGFIPTDAAPGRYGYGGLTSLGRWPITVGTKTVDQEVMLVEHAFFPIVLGRSFMEKRGVKTDPLDQTSITFMDSELRMKVLLVLSNSHTCLTCSRRDCSYGCCCC